MKIKTIKPGILFLLFIATLAVTSCKKSTNKTDNLIGTWTAGTPVMTAMVGTKTLTQYYTDVMGLTASQALIYTTAVNVALIQSFTGTIQFKSDNTYTSTLGGVTETGTWSLSTDGKTLTIAPKTGTQEIINISQLTANSLKANLTNTVSEDLNSDGTPETITISVDVTFSR